MGVVLLSAHSFKFRIVADFWFFFGEFGDFCSNLYLKIRCSFCVNMSLSQLNKFRQFNHVKSLFSLCSVELNSQKWGKFQIGKDNQFYNFNCLVGSDFNSVAQRSWDFSQTSWCSTAVQNEDYSDTNLVQMITSSENAEQLENILVENYDQLDQFSLGQASQLMPMLEGNHENITHILIKKYMEIGGNFDDAFSIYAFVRGLGLVKCDLSSEFKSLLVENINDHVQKFDTEQIQSILHKFVKLNIRPHFLVHKLVDQFCAQIDDANIEAIGKTFWSVGILNTQISAERRRDFKIRILEKIEEFDRISLTQIFYGLQKMKWRNTQLLTALCEQMGKIMRTDKKFELKHQISILQSLFQFNFYETDLFVFLIPEIQQNIDQISPESAVGLMNAMIATNYSNTNTIFNFFPEDLQKQSLQLLNSLIQNVAINFPEMSPVFWPRIFEAVSKSPELLSKNAQFTNSVLKTIQERIEILRSRQAASCLRLISFAMNNNSSKQLLQLEDVQGLINELIKKIKEDEGKLGPAMSADVILAMTSLGIEDEELKTMLLYQNQTTNL
eukprot:TRINITY_DN7970_c2_g1_i1.p1 TRINITY_DN7970_c2_g1~~TRINITY_DN7970_c2_g1_i1.p1  ORF type:complete len:556 (-),score=68.72 TRINITY_DN7970_c2_g1_i1:116-1783(-)